MTKNISVAIISIILSTLVTSCQAQYERKRCQRHFKCTLSCQNPCSVLPCVAMVPAMAIRLLGFDVGLGVFLITFLWFVALALIVIFFRIRTLLSLILTCVAAALTAIFLALPRANQLDDDGYPLDALSISQSEIIIDSVFVGRMIILGTLAVSSLLGVTLLFYLEVVQPKRKPVPGCLSYQRSTQQELIESIH